MSYNKLPSLPSGEGQPKHESWSGDSKESPALSYKFFRYGDNNDECISAVIMGWGDSCFLSGRHKDFEENRPALAAHSQKIRPLF
ncbi:MAG: hypothetical protein D3910_08770 [Candidatus Electrothrix sp. ATG2]|nr:hypothetical protein [Candidatus Electrothrix sp. ATG2]